MAAKPTEYRTVKLYPLLNHNTGCTKCIFSNQNISDSSQCKSFLIHITNSDSFRTCYGIYWAKGPDAQAQYILERLTS